MVRKLSKKFVGVFVLIIFFLFFHIQAISAQSPTVQSVAPPGRIAPKNILVDQLHANYTDKNHRYRLTVQGDNLNEETKDVVATFTWKLNCGKFYEGGKGPSSRYLSNRNRTIVWGYTYPEENCSEAEIQIKVTGYKGSDRQDEVTLKKKVFHPELQPTIDSQFYKGITPTYTLTWRQKIQLFIGNLWYKFKLLLGSPPDDPTSTEVPGGVTGRRD